ncbi:hypothetical protein J6590_011082 [Homalodisca vitripennis]|nr:hypothetical protein J6590_011082 [Homalodisca vitripennis]
MSSSGVVHPPASDAATDTDPDTRYRCAQHTWTPHANLKRVVHPPASDAATDTDPRHECTVAPNTCRRARHRAIVQAYNTECVCCEDARRYFDRTEAGPLKIRL